jgi:(5-formylfuran-3-yl)methyl phosphate synthase
MTTMLASVRNAEEAGIALAQDVDMIDVVDPSAGGIGAPSTAQVAAVVAAVQGRRGTSALAAGPATDPGVTVGNVRAAVSAGVDRVRVALLSDEGEARQFSVIDALAKEVDASGLVGVLFADKQDPLPLIPRLVAAGFGGVMLGLADKSRGRLLAQAGLPALSAFVAAAREHRLTVGLAGGLEAPDVPRLLALDPDFLGFRGALCASGDRRAAIAEEAVASIRQLIPRERSDAASAGERLAARGDRSEPAGNDTLRVFVRDYVLPVRIGAYSHERAEPQRVRFDVTVEVPRGRGDPRGIGDIFSYDLITDAISRIAAAGHVAFVETLAERIAADVLRHPAVRRVAVRVEKLELGPGAVGVELVMDRTAGGMGKEQR